MKVQKKIQSLEDLDRSWYEFATHQFFSGGHPNIVRLFGFTVNKNPRLAVGIQELVKGGCLFDYIKKKPFTMPVSRLLICQTACALDFIHGQGYVHRDVKAENLLVDGPLDVTNSQAWLKITDFGMTVPFIGQDT